MKEERCKNYTGLACIDGTCPIANRDTYIEYGIPLVWSCDDCHCYNGCDDCYFCRNDKCEIDEIVNN